MDLALKFYLFKYGDAKNKKPITTSNMVKVMSDHSDTIGE